MDYQTIAKYAAGAALIGSVLYLVITGVVASDQYLVIVTGALAALGITGARS